MWEAGREGEGVGCSPVPSLAVYSPHFAPLRVDDERSGTSGVHRIQWHAQSTPDRVTAPRHRTDHPFTGRSPLVTDPQVQVHQFTRSPLRPASPLAVLSRPALLLLLRRRRWMLHLGTVRRSHWCRAGRGRGFTGDEPAADPSRRRSAAGRRRHRVGPKNVLSVNVTVNRWRYRWNPFT